MATARFDTEKFTGKNDFALWKVKMRAILIQQGLGEALIEAKLPKEGENKEKRAEMMQKAHSAIILCLGDKVLREVAKLDSAAAVWNKLESLYMTKSLANRLYMKQRLYAYKISEDKSILDQIDEFNKAADDLADIDVKLDDEDKAIMLLNALPKSYEHLKDAMIYGRESTITLEEVINALRTKELQKISEVKSHGGNEGLNVKGKFQKGKTKKPWKDNKKSGNFKAKEADDKDTRKCHYCKKPGHIRKDCYSWKRKQAEKGSNGEDTADVTEFFQEFEALNVISSKHERDWVMDTGCSFHMCPNLSWFCSLQVKDLGSVVLGNNEICPIEGIGSVKLKLHDGTTKILNEVRKTTRQKEEIVPTKRM